jgi:hypothetical protein
MRYDQAAFNRDFIQAYGWLGAAAYKDGKLTTPATRYLEWCRGVYLNSAGNPLNSLVVGRIVKREGKSGPINLAEVGIDSFVRGNFGTTDHGAGGNGSVLDDTKWTIPMNDAWLLGGIHARHDIYMASPRTENNLVDPQYGCTVTGREVLGLTTFGYTPRGGHPTLGEAFVCTDSARAEGASFVAYAAAVQEALQTDGFRKLIA